VKVIMANLFRVRVTLQFVGGSPGVSTTYHDATGSPSLASAQAASDRVRGAWDVVKTILAPSFVATPQAAVDVLSDTDGQLIQSFGITPLAAVVGTAATAQGPGATQAGLILNTSTVADRRRLRGRLFVGPLPTGFTASVTPPAAVLTAIQAMGTALVTVSPPAAVAPLKVWHRPIIASTGDVVRLGSSAFVTSSSPAAKYFVLRSRRD
jgi:hypothetical protein